MPRGAMVNTPDFGSGNPRSNRGGATKINPRGVMVAAMDSKSIPAMGCRFDSGRGYKIGGGHKRQCKSVPTGDVQQDCKRTDALTQKPVAGPPTILQTGPIPGNLK